MAGYPSGGGMNDVLEAMKKKLIQTSQIPYVRQARIKIGAWVFPPWENYQVYIEPVGSPEEIIGERGRVFLKYATHIVNVECVMPWQSPDEEDAIIGRSNTNVGLTGFVSDMLSYLESNQLGLTGLANDYLPVIEAPDGAYREVELEDQVRLRVATLRWEGRTAPFARSIDT
jgi:hypothetical protein